jgi:predicted house-cleaning noncanonical NTP pyrophosphatase (MazG superfamily)
MPTKYNKLIRDKILAGLDKKGIPYKSHIADDAEYNEKLFLKVLEESAEVATEESDDKIKEEIADLLEVIEAIKKFKNFSDEEIEEIRLKKLEEKGGFEKRIILDES